MEAFSDAAKSAQGFARSPLRIIALFIVLVHGFASLVVALSGNLSEAERWPIVIFLVSFPVLVLPSFCWLVANHSEKLYGPSDFRDDQSFLAFTDRLKVAVALGQAPARPKTSSTQPGGQREPGGSSEPSVASDQRPSDEISAEVAAALDPRRSWAAARGKVVLWVDGHPESNVNEAAALRSAGLVGVNVTDTDEAIQQLKSSKFDVVVTDMTRGLNRDAGYELLDRMTNQGLKLPVIIYAGKPGAVDRKKARERGAVDRVYGPTELFRLVIAEASRKSS